MEKETMPLTEETILKKINEVLGHYLLEGYTDESIIWETLKNKLRFIEFIFELENMLSEYGIAIEETDLEKVSAVKDYKQRVLKKLADKNLM